MTSWWVNTIKHIWSEEYVITRRPCGKQNLKLLMPTRSIPTPLLECLLIVLTFWLRTRFLFSHNLVNNWSICSCRLKSQAIFRLIVILFPFKTGLDCSILAITLSPSYSSLLSRFYCHLHVPFRPPPLWTCIFVCSTSSSWIVHISDHLHQQSPNKSLNQFTLNISTKAPFKQLRLVSKWSCKKRTCGKEQYLF